MNTIMLVGWSGNGGGGSCKRDADPVSGLVIYGV